MQVISPVSRAITVVVVGIAFFVVTRFDSHHQPEKVILAKPTQSPNQAPPVVPLYTQLSGESINDAFVSMRAFDRLSGKDENPDDRILIEASVKRLIQQLQSLQVSAVVLEPGQVLAQGEWNYRRREIRLHPIILKSGLRAFSKTLNHEVIHEVQSCSGGGVTGYPRPIGLVSAPNKEVQEILMKPPYAGKSSKVLDLEMEAFMHQDRPDLVSELLIQFCFP